MKETRELWETELRTLNEIEPQALARLEKAARAYKEAKKAYLEAKDELESIRSCAKEAAWMMEHAGARAS
jgi:hypothetical protein